MQPTRRKAPTNSLIAKVENALSEVSAGLPVQRYLQQARVLVGAVRYLLRENHRLTSSNAQLRKQLQQLEQIRHRQIKELNRLQLQSFNKSEASAPPLPDRVWRAQRRERERSAQATARLCNM